MRSKVFIVGLICLFFVNVVSQKLSEEDTLEGSANLINPDDEDFEASGAPVEEETPKPTTVSPGVVEKIDNQHEVLDVQTSTDLTTDSATIPVPANYGDKEHILIIVIIAIVVLILALFVLVVVCRRKKASQNAEGYTQGSPRTDKDFV